MPLVIAKRGNRSRPKWAIALFGLLQLWVAVNLLIGCHPKRSPDGTGIYYQVYLGYCEYEHAHRRPPPADVDWIESFEEFEPGLREQVSKAPKFLFNKIPTPPKAAEDQTIFLYEVSTDSQGMRTVVFYSGRSERIMEAEFIRRYGSLLSRSGPSSQTKVDAVAPSGSSKS